MDDMDRQTLMKKIRWNHGEAKTANSATWKLFSKDGTLPSNVLRSTAPQQPVEVMRTTRAGRRETDENSRNCLTFDF